MRRNKYENWYFRCHEEEVETRHKMEDVETRSIAGRDTTQENCTVLIPS